MTTRRPRVVPGINEHTICTLQANNNGAPIVICFYYKSRLGKRNV
jgi:hypothetical protein